VSRQHDTGSREEQQRLITNRIFSEYDLHYGDVSSGEYRRRFIYEPLFEKIPLEGKRVLDAMCGGGYTTGYLLSKGAVVDGLDISDTAVKTYADRWKESRVLCSSILDIPAPDGEYDCVAIVGGLHHAHPDTLRAIDEIYRILKPGGYFCFYEPHNRSVFDKVRRIWYKRDRFFAENEAAIDLEALKAGNAHRFEFIREEYGGSLAYLFVLNSAILRVPGRLKPFYSPLFMGIESLVAPFVPRSLSLTVLSQWKKR